MRKLGFSISNTALAEGLLAAFNPARMERLPCGLILDGAHNTSAMKELCKALSKMNKPLYICIAMMEDKDIQGSIAELAKISPEIIVTEINMPRCLRAESVAAEFAKYNINVQIDKDPISAAKTALALAGKSGTAVVCGSLYLAGEVRKNLK